MTAHIPSEGSPENLNLRRRVLPGLLARCLLTPLAPMLRLCARSAGRSQNPQGHVAEPVFVFASYMVGDLYMALPALKRLAAARAVRVLCRPDCAGLIADENMERLVPVAFDNAFLTDRSLRSFLRTLRAARALRRRLEVAAVEAAAASLAVDLDASPLSALWLRLAGFPRVASYRRDYGALFTETFDLPVEAVHQADRDEAVVTYVLNAGGLGVADRGEDKHERRDATAGTTTSHAPWLFSVWTRKASKNWPLDHWDALLERLQAEGVACAILIPPDGDEAFHAFRARWEARVPFVGGTLDDVARLVRGAAGVVATDNFLGHMAGYFDKPVLWINLCSPGAQVKPRGPRTLEVATDGAGRATPSGAPPTPEAVARAFHALRRDG